MFEKVFELSIMENKGVSKLLNHSLYSNSEVLSKAVKKLSLRIGLNVYILRFRKD